MGNGFQTSATGITAILVLGCARVVAGQAAPTPVAVELITGTHGDEDIIGWAAEQTSEIYRHAGIALVWNSGPGTLAAPGTLTLVLIVLPEPMAGVTAPNAAVFGAAAESADGCGRVARIFYDRVIGSARAHKIHPSALLSMVMAHELGHLLLPHTSHSLYGLMKADWDPSDLQRAGTSRARFSKDEAARMHAQIAREVNMLAERESRATEWWR